VLLLEFQPGAATPVSFDRTRRQTLAAFLNANRNNRTMIRAFRRGVRLISRQSGSCLPLLWGYARACGSILFRGVF